MDSCTKLNYGFSNSVKLYPNKTAILYYEEPGSSSESHFTYFQLSEAETWITRNIDHHLNRSDVTERSSCPEIRDDGNLVIGIYCSYAPAVVGCMLGVLKAQLGAPFFYLSPDLSSLERSILLKAVDPVAFLVDESLFETLQPDFPLQKKCQIEVLNRKLYLAFSKNYEAHLGRRGGNFAYVMTTSGSTGVPKLVFVPHQCIVPNITDFVRLFEVGVEDTILNVSPLSFDPSIVNLFLGLNCGASVIMASKDMLKRPKCFDLVFRRNFITILQCTPTFLNMLDPLLLKHLFADSDRALKMLALGGEQFSLPSGLRQILDGNCKTRIFNLYGVTEVSCWATCLEVRLKEYLLQKDLLEDPSHWCSLGTPLSGTSVDVCDEREKPVQEREEGSIFISGDRACCKVVSCRENGSQPSSKSDPPSCSFVRGFVCTGDRGYVVNNNIYYLGRNDDIVKRSGGHKVSLIEIENISKSLFDNIVNCCAVSVYRCIYLYITLKSKTESTSDTIKEGLRANLSMYKLPEEIFVLGELPVTSNGKVNRQHLAARGREWYHSTLSSRNKDLTTHLMLDLAQRSLDSFRPNLSDNFFSLGGTSLQAVLFCELIQQIFKVEVPFLFQTMFDKSLIEVRETVNRFLLESCMDSSPTFELCKGDPGMSPEIEVVDHSAKISSRRGCYMGGRRVSIQQFANSSDAAEVEWKVNFFRCIDASPVVLDRDRSLLAFLGSHSGIFSCVEVSTGLERWSTHLRDRIEASATVSWSGDKVFVGCYDYHLYCLDTRNGDVLWKFETAGVIKSVGDVNNKYMSLVFGSHDGCIYCLDLSGSLKWKYCAASGSIFSSPIVVDDFVYSATLGGYLICNDVITGKCLWRSFIGKPIFSSIASFSGGIVFGCVDKNVYCFSFEGNQLWVFSAKAPIFSSPFVIEPGSVTLIAIGCHDNCVYLLNANGALLHTFVLSSEVYGIPYLVCPRVTKEELEIGVVVSETNGNITVFFANFHINPFKCVDFRSIWVRLGGKVFSSPVLVNDKIYVGCRDNDFYCIKLYKK